MARIYINVHPDGTFTTGPCHGDPVAHAASQPEGVTTYMSECADIQDTEPFGMVFRRHTIAVRMGFAPVGRWTGDWRKWGAFCTNKWGVWFERVDGSKRRALLPSADDMLDARVLGVLKRRGHAPILYSVLKNTFRNVPEPQLRTSLDRLMCEGFVEKQVDGTRASVVVTYQLYHGVKRVSA